MQSQDLYDKYLAGRHWDGHPTAYAESFADFLKISSFCGLLVDIGCGSGRDVDVFRRAGFEVIGVDYSESEIELAKKRFFDCMFEVQDAEHLGFASSSAGALFVINVIHYLDQKKAFREFSRILRPRGHIFIHFNLEIKDRDGNTDYSQKESEILDLVSGFTIVQKKIFERTDLIPKPHTHRILELILQK